MNQRRDEGAGRGRRAAAALVFFACLGLHREVAAAPRTTPALPCTPEGGEAVRITGIGEDFSVTLADGRSILLVGVDPVRATATGPDLAAAAHAKLRAWLIGRSATLRVLAAAPDRWNRIPALLFADLDAAPSAASPGLSVALAMVDAGLGRARPDPDAHGCWPDLLLAEQAARAARIGLWSDPAYAVLDAADQAAIGNSTGAMAIVEGAVTRVGHGRSRLYIAMGGRQADFSIRLARRDSFILTELGLSEDRLSGVSLRVRGFLDDRFGASIDVTRGDQIEVLTPPGAPMVVAP
ncbi:thermonuclease family protein [Lichenihabitans psoromatis]|uniref:thermonuclease family protein n=1 Tax=Lichenihabitans psoromatis TaxID=2528642 RepID=UPI00103836D7|nr:thermonuclease family protein [Lichenihabitans psoromatis]